MKHIHLSVGGPDRVITDGKALRWTFEDHPRFGPIVLNSRGDPMPKQPGERSSFWLAWKHWNDQGKRLQPDGKTCVWDAPPAEPELVHLGGRNYAHAGSSVAARFGRKT